MLTWARRAEPSLNQGRTEAPERRVSAYTVGLLKPVTSATALFVKRTASASGISLAMAYPKLLSAPRKKA